MLPFLLMVVFPLMMMFYIVKNRSSQTLALLLLASRKKAHVMQALFASCLSDWVLGSSGILASILWALVISPEAHSLSALLIVLIGITRVIRRKSTVNRFRRTAARIAQLDDRSGPDQNLSSGLRLRRVILIMLDGNLDNIGFYVALSFFCSATLQTLAQEYLFRDTELIMPIADVSNGIERYFIEYLNILPISIVIAEIILILLIANTIMQTYRVGSKKSDFESRCKSINSNLSSIVLMIIGLLMAWIELLVAGFMISGAGG